MKGNIFGNMDAFQRIIFDKIDESSLRLKIY